MRPSEFRFADIRRLVKDEGDSKLLGDVDLILGAVLVASGAGLAVGGAAIPAAAALGLLGPKNELFKLGNALVRKLLKRGDGGIAACQQRMMAAHQLVVYSAFLEAADEILALLPSKRMKKSDRAALAGRVMDLIRDDVSTSPSAPESPALAHLVIRPRHFADSLDDYGRDLCPFYDRRTSDFSQFVTGLPAFAAATEDVQSRVLAALATLPHAALAAYDAQYLTLAVDSAQFRTWVQLRHNDLTAKRLSDVSEAVAERLVEMLVMQRSLDIGLAALGASIAELSSVKRREHAGRVLDAVALKYEDAISKPIFSDQWGVRDGETALCYPDKADAFIPQGFKVLRCETRADGGRLADQATWRDIPPEDGLSQFLLAYLGSLESTEAPLVILGEPGSGKSLLSEMIAARVATPYFTPLRVPLRDAKGDEIHEQLQHRLGHDAKESIDWATVSSQITDLPPVVIFDGLDELLQLEGAKHADYLDCVKTFQADERVQGRPVRAIVTSRITRINKTRIPAGSTVVRLLDFDRHRREAWIGIWNGCNEAYFGDTAVERFELPEASPVGELARQPLLLFMLALFDAVGNRVTRGGDVDRTELYHDLLHRFAERQHSKGRRFVSREEAVAIKQDMRRLGIAAISMFNRGTLHLLSEQLATDLAFFERCWADAQPPGTPAVSLAPADLFEMSFFVNKYVSRADHGEREATYEFLHNTFGEFLTADFILRQLLDRINSEVATSPESGAADAAGRDRAGTDRPDEWFATLMFTALHTRPVVVEMMQSLTDHLLIEYGIDRSDFTGHLDRFVATQLAETVGSRHPPAPFMQSTPYGSMPLLAHYAIYTLNLIVVRLAVSDEPFVLRNDPDPRSPRGATLWDQLTHLWRAWLPVDQFAAAVRVSHSTHDGSRGVSLQPGAGFARNHAVDRLETAWRTAVAFGDRLTAAALGAHLHDAADSPPIELDDIAEDLRAEGVDLELELDMRRLRSEGWPRERDRLHALARHARNAVALDSTSRSHRDLLVALMEPDAPLQVRLDALRGLKSSRSLDGYWTIPESFLVAHIRFCATAAPLWTAELVEQTLLHGQPERLARSAPNAFAACLDVVCPAGTPLYLPARQHDGVSWLRETITRLAKGPRLDPVVIVALADLAARVGAMIDDGGLCHSCLGQLLDRRQYERSMLARIPSWRMRRLIGLVDDTATGADLADWIAPYESGGLARDLHLDLARLGLRAKLHARLDRHEVGRCPVPQNAEDMVALLRLIAALEPEAGQAERPGLGRDGFLAYLADVNARGWELRVTREFAATLPLGVRDALREILVGVKAGGSPWLDDLRRWTGSA